MQCLPALWTFSLKLSVVTYHTQGVVFDYRVLVRMNENADTIHNNFISLFL